MSRGPTVSGALIRPLLLNCIDLPARKAKTILHASSPTPSSHPTTASAPSGSFVPLTSPTRQLLGQRGGDEALSGSWPYRLHIWSCS